MKKIIFLVHCIEFSWKKKTFLHFLGIVKVVSLAVQQCHEFKEIMKIFFLLLFVSLSFLFISLK